MFSKKIELNGPPNKIKHRLFDQLARYPEFGVKDVDDNHMKVEFGSWWSYKDDKKGTAELQMGINDITVNYSFLGETILAILIMYLPLLLVVSISAYGGIYPITIIMALILLGFIKYHHYCFKKTADNYHYEFKNIIYVLESDEFDFCFNCGNPVEVSGQRDDDVCPCCRYNMGLKKMENQTLYNVYGMETQIDRPTGVTVITGFLVLGALLSLGGMVFPTISTLPQIFGTIGLSILLIQAIFNFAVAYGLWNGLKWAWYGAIILAFIGLINVGFGTFVGILILFYLFNVRVKAYFNV